MFSVEKVSYYLHCQEHLKYLFIYYPQSSIAFCGVISVLEKGEFLVGNNYRSGFRQ